MTRSQKIKHRLYPRYLVIARTTRVIREYQMLYEITKVDLSGLEAEEEEWVSENSK